MKPKLCIITETTWWDTDNTVLPNLKDRFQLDIHVISKIGKNKYSEDEIYKAQKELGINIKVWKRIGRIRNPLNFFLFLKIYRIIKKNDPKNTWINYVYMYDPYMNFLIILINKYKKLISVHDYNDHIGMDSFLRNLLKHVIYKRNKIFHFYSEMELDKFKKDYPAKRAFFTTMPLKDYGEPASFGNIRDRDTKRSFLFFGTIRHYKGLDLLIKAINQIKRDDYKLLIAGNTNDWDDYKILIGNNPNIIADIGFINNDDIPKYFSNADFLILPYRTTTQSGPELISLNYNVPIIASNLAGFKSAINNGVDGFLFEKENVEALVDVLNETLNMDEESYSKMKKAQYLKVLEYRGLEKNIGAIYYESLENIKA